MNEEKDVKKKTPKVKVPEKEVNSPVKVGLKSKDDIVKNWLPRYTGRALDEFGDYIILTNFSKYVQLFSEWHKPQLKTEYTYNLIANNFGVSVRTAKRYVRNGKNGF